MPDQLMLYVIAGVVAIVATRWAVMVAPWWLRARRAKLRLSPVEITAMRLRRTDLRKVIGALAAAKEAGLEVWIGTIEAHVLSGGDPEAAIAAFVEARRRGDVATLDDVLALDLAGMDVVSLARAGVPLAGLLGSERSAELGARFRKRL